MRLAIEQVLDLEHPAGLAHPPLDLVTVEGPAHVEAEGIDVVGPTNHGIFQSIYFFDPNGHRLELAANTRTDEQMKQLNEVAPAMIEEWSRTKKAPRHAAWLHENN